MDCSDIVPGLIGTCGAASGTTSQEHILTDVDNRAKYPYVPGTQPLPPPLRSRHRCPPPGFLLQPPSWLPVSTLATLFHPTHFSWSGFSKLQPVGTGCCGHCLDLSSPATDRARGPRTSQPSGICPQPGCGAGFSHTSVMLWQPPQLSAIRFILQCSWLPMPRPSHPNWLMWPNAPTCHLQTVPSCCACARALWHHLSLPGYLELSSDLCSNGASSLTGEMGSAHLVLS